MADDKIEIENVNTPGRTERVDRAKYLAMRDALLAILPDKAPGLKVADAKEIGRASCRERVWTVV